MGQFCEDDKNTGRHVFIRHLLPEGSHSFTISGLPIAGMAKANIFLQLPPPCPFAGDENSLKTN